MKRDGELAEDRELSYLLSTIESKRTRGPLVNLEKRCSKEIERHGLSLRYVVMEPTAKKILILIKRYLFDIFSCSSVHHMALRGYIERRFVLFSLGKLTHDYHPTALSPQSS